MTEIKKLKTTENVIEEQEQEEVCHQVYFGTASPFAQSVVLCHIFENHLSLFEQIEMRRVCRLWHYNVKHIWNKEQSLVLTVKDESMKPSLSPDLNKPKLTYEGNQFYSLQMAKGFELTIGINHWNQPTIDLLGDLFRNIEHLTIFYELSGWLIDPNCNLCYFLQKFPKVKSFSLVMPQTSKALAKNGIGGIASKEFLSKLFKMINDHLSPLHTLNLYLPNYNNSYSAVDIEHFHKTLPYLQNFSFNSTVRNINKMLQSMGKSLPARWPIQSLSINVGFDKLLSPVETLFKRNPALSHLNRLELTGLNTDSYNIVNRLLDHFAELECLNLCRCLYSLTIKTLSKLPRLKELYLWGFEIQIFTGWSNRGLAKSLVNIRKLNITVLDLSHSVKYQYYKVNNFRWPYEPVEPRSTYGLFLHNLAKQFPKLEHLTLNMICEKFDENFSDWCYAEFNHLKSLILNGKQ